MCGIAGIIMRRGEVPIQALKSMQQALHHRGPDDEGVYIEGSMGLVHTRLSIVDLERGRQPMYDNYNNCLVANAEIYNHIAIRETLEHENVYLNTQSDCEVILPLYRKYKRHCVEQMRGMFAFAIWDSKKRSLLLARDRMGEKPLYYFLSEDYLVFASELRALLASNMVPMDIDWKQIARYFIYQYVPEPKTPFCGIEKLPAGTTIVLNQNDWTITADHYWSPWNVPPLEADPKTQIRSSLEDAIKHCLIGDVPLGLSLSGGIDSSILACIMREYSDKEIHAISIGYPRAGSVDERPQARKLARKLNLTFHDVELSDDEMLDTFPSVVNSRDDPIGDISGYNYYSIMKHAKNNNIKVMLQGHGLDELCWGYSWVKNAVAINDGRNGLLNIFKNRNGYRSSFRQLLTAIKSRYVDIKHKNHFRMFDLQPYCEWILAHSNTLFTEHFRHISLWSLIDSANEYGEMPLRTDLEVTRLITEFYLRENGIAQGDRLSMAHSVEMRLPFVDHKFVETIIGLRKHHRDDQLPAKYWLKESVRDLLDSEILERPKRGFAPPVMRWQKAIRNKYGNCLRDGILVSAGILNEDTARQLTTSNIQNTSEATVSRLAIILELWLQGIMNNNDIHAYKTVENIVTE